MDISLAVSIFLWVVIASLAVISSRRAIACLAILMVSGYIALRSNSVGALWPLVASLMLWLGTALISIRRYIIGTTRRDIENSGALASIPFLGFSATLLFKHPGYGAFGILIWFFLWYYLKNACKSLRALCLLILYLPTILFVILYRTPIVVVYGIITLWLQNEIKILQNVRNKEELRGENIL